MSCPFYRIDVEHDRWLAALYSRRPGKLTDLERKQGTKVSAPFFKKYGG